MGSEDREDDRSPAPAGIETVPQRRARPGAAGDAHHGSGELGDRPDSDDLRLAVARSRIGSQLFGSQERVKLGRYHLLEVVGSGGMGVVWGGWDPELERRVAIKLVKEAAQVARNRILLEGQALAKLSHPNVVPVYDVGVVDEQVYLVMEWVRGENLRRYCATPRSVRAIVAVYRAAGEGLFAAHQAGLIHRDFKPDNAILGEDGRVRVLDFGLARDHAPRAATDGGLDTAGTPQYMPPEQAEGGELSSAVDQFAFCVSLREALVGRDGRGTEAAVPGWLAAIIERGSRAAPADRYPSMAELLHDLGRDPRTVWRRRLLATAAIGAAAAAFVIGSLRSGSRDIEPCVGGAEDIGGSWNSAIEARMVQHLDTLGRYGEEAARTLPAALTAYTGRWATEHRKRCLAFERGELTQPLYERTLACFARVRTGFETTIAVLSTTPADRLSQAVVAAHDVPEADHCSIEGATSSMTPPSPGLAPAVAVLAREIERARSLARADEPTALAVARVVTSRAEALGYKPILARAQLAEGFVLARQQRGPEAVPLFDRASANALDANDDVTFVEAYARELYEVGVTDEDQLQSEHREIAGAVPFAERVAIRLGAEAGFERSLLFNNIGASRLTKGDRAGARTWFDRALGESRELRDRQTELVVTLGNRALVAESDDERDALLEQERETFARSLGPNHRDTLASRIKAAMFTSAPRLAADKLGEPCSLLRRYHLETARARVDDCTYQLGWLAEERGDLAETRAMMSALDTALARAYLQAADGQLVPAAEAARAFAVSVSGEWWSKLVAVDGYLIAAVWFDRAGRAREAMGDLEHALALATTLPLFDSAPFARRRLARARALAARLLAPSDPGRARQLATEAVTWYRTTRGYERSIGELDQLLARLPITAAGSR